MKRGVLPSTINELPPGAPPADAQRGELKYWVDRGLQEWALHLPFYRRVFALDRIDYDSTAILDVGSGPISVFEALAPSSARLTPYDSLAEDYNRIAPSKKFPVTGTLPDRQFDLITMFNCLDHMADPAQLLEALESRLCPQTGRLWIYVHIDRPFSPVEHPQDFRFWDVIALVQRRYDLMASGLTREGDLYPYAWWGVAKSRERGVLRRTISTLGWNMSCAAAYARFHGRRGTRKALRVIGTKFY
jgi:SAM-dependent methyltransferase